MKKETHYKIEPNKPLSELLTEITSLAIGRIGCQNMRPWHITFTRGNYGYFDTALCEMEGSPVKAYVLANLDSYPESLVVLDRFFTKSRRSVPEEKRRKLYSLLRKICPEPNHHHGRPIHPIV